MFFSFVLERASLFPRHRNIYDDTIPCLLYTLHLVASEKYAGICGSMSAGGHIQRCCVQRSSGIVFTSSNREVRLHERLFSGVKILVRSREPWPSCTPRLKSIAALQAHVGRIRSLCLLLLLVVVSDRDHGNTNRCSRSRRARIRFETRPLDY